jgi:DNA polymerase-3 subunit alpha
MSKTPSRFVGLHSHSGFSVFDGMGYPQEHIDFVLENGMDAWALTDHGHMNGFAHAYLHTERLQRKRILS